MSEQRMAHVYERNGDQFSAPVDKRRCRASVQSRDGWRSGQCQRKVKLEVGGYGWCQQHSPEAIAARDAKRGERDAGLQRKWDAEAVGRAYARAMEETGDPARAAAEAYRVWKRRRDSA